MPNLILHCSICNAVAVAVVLLMLHLILLPVPVQAYSSISQSRNGGSEACNNLSPGSFLFVSINAWPETTTDNVAVAEETSRRRHGEVAIVGFQDIPGNLDLYLTDRAWNGTDDGFVRDKWPYTLQNEGTVQFTTPPEGIPAGVTFGMGDDLDSYKYGNDWVDIDTDNTNYTSSWENTTYYFHLGIDGDQVFLYCINNDGKDRPIAGISYRNLFLNYAHYGTTKSSAPSYFPGYNAVMGDINSTLLVLPESTMIKQKCEGIFATCWASYSFLKWKYSAPMDDFIDRPQLKASIMDTQHNWIGSNPDGTMSSSSVIFTLTSASTPTFLLSMMVYVNILLLV